MRPLRHPLRSSPTLARVGALCVAMALPACLEGIEGSLRDVDTSSLDASPDGAGPREPATDTRDTTDTTPPDATPRPGDDVRTGDPRPEPPLAALPICRPEPAGLDAPAAPALPADAFDACGLVRTSIDASPTDLGRGHEVTSILRDEEVIVVETRRVDDLSRTLVRFHGATPERGPRRIERIITSNYPYSGPLREETTWMYDGAGHLAEVVLRGAEGTTSTWRWTRMEGRLVAQSFEHRRDAVLLSSRSMVWHWEGERLRFGSQFDSETGVMEQTEWSWDSRGRILAIERRVDTPLVAAQGDGADTPPPWHRLAFEWTSDGRLAAREVSSFAPSGPADGGYEFRRAPMDDFEARIPWRADYSSTWPADPRPRFAESLWRVRADGACRLPPSAETHGWPEEERAYELGFGDGFAEGGLGWRYGYGGYGYGYGEEAWLGPEGLGADAWPGVAPAHWVWRSFDNRIAYDDAGRMISEHFALTGDFDPAGGPPAEVGTLIRERVFETATAAPAGGGAETLNPFGMRSDVSVFAPAEAGAPVVRRTLDWSGTAELGAVGRTDWTRTLSADGVTVVEDRLTTDAAGTTDRWVVSLGDVGVGWAPFHAPWHDAPARALRPTTELERVRDAEGRVIAASVKDLDGDGSWRSEMRITRGADGEIVETVEGSSNPGSWQTVSRWDGGVLVLSGSGQVDPDGALQLTDGTRYRHDEDGRLLETERFSGQGTIVETRHYACDE